jgi:hypothetical protein
VAQDWQVEFDGQIKAPPSVVVHVVGFVEEIAMALGRGLLATLPKISANLPFTEPSPSNFWRISVIAEWRRFSG